MRDDRANLLGMIRGRGGALTRAWTSAEPSTASHDRTLRDRDAGGWRRGRLVAAALALVLGVTSFGAPQAFAEDDIVDEDLAGAAVRVQEQLLELQGHQDQAEALLVELQIKVAGLESEMAAAQAAWVTATENVASATARSEQLGAAAEEAAAAAAEADAELIDSLRRMYVRPPRTDQAAVMGASNLEDQLQIHAVLSTQSSQRQRLLRKASSARDLADRRAAEAESARDDAERREKAAADAAESLDAARVELNEEMAYVSLLLEALETQHADLSAEASELAARAAVQQAARNIDVDESTVVRVPGTTISVHPLIGFNAVALIEAAREDGVMLDGWGWRSTQRQIELRAAHCGGDAYSIFEKPSGSCSPPTARPGRSMHERGLAIDFKNCSSRSTPCFEWLAENAVQFGFHNLPSEPWHWSVNGN